MPRDEQTSPGAPRPLAVTIIGWLFIAVGAIGATYHGTELNFADPFGNDTLLLTAIRLLAVLSGTFLLRGRNWARWLLLAWIAFHVGVSALDTHQGLVAHAVLLVVVAWFLLRPPAAGFFRKAG
jgi:hypothetical protein